MTQPQPGPLARVLRRLAGADAALVSDADLLRRFARHGDQAAFELILWRHGPMVLRACRAILRHEQDAEDAFQAAFLVLARKAGAVASGAALGAWLHRVACRIACKQARRSRDHSARERHGLDLSQLPCGKSGDAVAEADAASQLHEEVERLPAKYRAPIVLCYLEGKTNDEAAAHLGWTKGTVSGRLARARDLLRRRLQRRGAALLSLPVLAAAPEPSPELLVNTLRAAGLARAGDALASAASANVVALTEGALRAMFLTRCKLVVAVLVLAVAGGAALLWSVGAASGGDPPALVRTQPDGPPAGKQPAGKPQVIRVASPREGIVVVVGTEVKKDDGVGGEKRIEVQYDHPKETRTYRPLREGDLVEAGQMLAQIDDRLSRQDLQLAGARMLAARAELDGARALANEAQMQLARLTDLRNRAPGSVPEAEYRTAALACERHRADVNLKEVGVRLAEIEMNRAQIIVDMHLVRSPVRGILQRIEKQTGEGVRALETMFEIRPVAAKQ